MIGRVRALKIDSTQAVFFCEYGRDAATGREVDLEASTDFPERVEAVHRFTADPASYPQHRR